VELIFTFFKFISGIFIFKIHLKFKMINNLSICCWIYNCLNFLINYYDLIIFINMLKIM